MICIEFISQLRTRVYRAIEAMITRNFDAPIIKLHDASSTDDKILLVNIGTGLRGNTGQD